MILREDLELAGACVLAARRAKLIAASAGAFSRIRDSIRVAINHFPCFIHLHHLLAIVFTFFVSKVT